MRMELPSLPIALSSYRYPSYHPQIPWDEFLAKCDIAMPQVYWVLSHNPHYQLERTMIEYQSMNYVRPVIPTGCGYKQGEWEPSEEDITKFMEKARELNLSAVNFWEWAHTRRFLPEIFNKIKEYKWEPDSEVNIGRQYIDALNTQDPDKIVDLYTDYAVHVTSRKTLQGKGAIREWYVELFNERLPNAYFSLTNTLGKGRMRHISWTANSSAGDVNFGNDTVSISNNKISYHYSFFIVT